MAAIRLNSVQRLAISSAWAPSVFPSALLRSAFLLPSFAAQRPPASRSLAETLLEGLRELLPPWVLAVPKKKTSHSKKAMRSSGKGLKEQTAIVECPSCGGPKRAHYLCRTCLTDFRQTLKRGEREAEGLLLKA